MSIAELIERNRNVLASIIVDRTNGAHGFVTKYALIYSDGFELNRLGYLTDLHGVSSVWMLTDLGRALVAGLNDKD
jgi:hypothetical protein